MVDGGLVCGLVGEVVEECPPGFVGLFLGGGWWLVPEGVDEVYELFEFFFGHCGWPVCSLMWKDFSSYLYIVCWSCGSLSLLAAWA